MRQKIIDFLKLPTSKHVVINTLGNYLNVFFTAFFALILVRIMSPVQYGVLSVLLGISYVLANVLDFGTTATIYSYIPPLLEKKNKQKQIFRFIKTIFTYQTILSIIVIIALFLSFPYLDKVFFKTQAPKQVLYLTSISVLFFIWQNFIANILFSANKFLKANLYLNLANVLKTLVLLFMVVDGTISVGSVIFVFGIVGPAIFFLLMFLEKRDLVFVLLKSEVRREEFKLGYTLTYFLASQFLNLGLRMDLFLLSFYGLREGVGHYGLAQKVILSIATTIISITQVLSPNFARVQNKREGKSNLKTGLLYLMVPVGLFIILFLTPDVVYRFVFTDKFTQTAPITRSLVFPFIIYTLANLPQTFLLYTAKKPQYILYPCIIFFALMTAGNYFLIPQYKVFAPSYVLTASFLVILVVWSLATAYEYKKLPK